MCCRFIKSSFSDDNGTHTHTHTHLYFHSHSLTCEYACVCVYMCVLCLYILIKTIGNREIAHNENSLDFDRPGSSYESCSEDPSKRDRNRADLRKYFSLPGVLKY